MTTRGPRDTSTVPTFTVPRLACDCHAHVIGPAREFPYVPDRSFTPPDAPTDQYRQMLARLGLDRAVVVQPSVYGTDNRRTVTAVAEIGQSKARGVVMVDAAVPSGELRRLHDQGMRATRFITTARGGPRIDQLPAVAAKVATVGWHIEVYVPPGHWDNLLPVIERLPVPVAFDHMAGLPADTRASDPTLRAILSLLERERAWVKLCGYRNSIAGYPYDDVRPLARQFVERVPQRCVWGTDWPHTNISEHMPDDGELLNLLADWAPDPGVRQQILVDNPARLYGF